MLPKLRVGLSPIWGASFLVLAALDVWLYLATHSGVQLALAVIMAIAGVSHLVGAILLVDGNTIELKNPIGMTLRTFTIDSPNDLRMEGRKLFIKVGDQAKKISGLMANGGDWNKLRDAIDAAQKTS